MRIESSVTAVSWIPSEAVEGLPKIPFTMGVAHYDDPPPDVIEDLDALREADAFREANELRAFVEVEDGKIAGCGHLGRGHLGVTRMKLGPRELSVAAVALPTIQGEPEVGEGWVRFTQTAGGRTGMPAPRRVRGKPFFQINSAIAWTTLALTIKADGSSEHELTGASPFPRHWVYDNEGKLVQKSGMIDFDQWYRESYGKNTPWGDEDSPAFVTEIESALERELSRSIMRKGAATKPRKLDADETLTSRASRATSSISSSTACSRWTSTARPSPRSGQARSSASGQSSRAATAQRLCARSRPRRSWRWRPTRSSPRRSRSSPAPTGERRASRA